VLSTTIIGIAGKVAPVSVVVPCFNCADTLERAVESIAKQSKRPAEVILVDDASTDTTAEVIDGLARNHPADWIRVITLDKNGGPSTARNAGWDVARYEYLAFLDADDTWHARKIELQWSFMNANPDVTLCGHGYRVVGTGEALRAGASVRSVQRLTCARLLISNRLATRTVMLRRGLKFRFLAGKRYAEDYLLWLQIVCSGHEAVVLGSQLAYAYKAPFGASGLSARLWDMEKGELETYEMLAAEGRINRAIGGFLAAFSLLRYMRRVVFVWCSRLRGPWRASSRDRG
jgi:glycosyltransferase involved in cell wall biosynthesis